jgi:hypothetical protein
VHCVQITDHYLLYSRGVLKMNSSHALTSHKGHTQSAHIPCVIIHQEITFGATRCESCRPSTIFKMYVAHIAPTRAFAIPFFAHLLLWEPSFARAWICESQHVAKLSVRWSRNGKCFLHNMRACYSKSRDFDKWMAADVSRDSSFANIEFYTSSLCNFLNVINCEIRGVARTFTYMAFLIRGVGT